MVHLLVVTGPGIESSLTKRKGSRRFSMNIFSTMATETTDKVKDYYGKRVQCQDDLQTQACIADDTVLPKYIKQILSQVHDEVMARYGIHAV